MPIGSYNCDILQKKTPISQRHNPTDIYQRYLIDECW